jgi:hypothetical protein
MTEKEEEKEKQRSEYSPRGDGKGKRLAKLELYGKQVDSIEDELRAWSKLIDDLEREAGKKRSFLSGWKRSKESRSKSHKRKRKR